MHPYETFPKRQFWSRAVARNFDPSTVGSFPTPLIKSGDAVVTAGSCFAANLIPFLEQAGFKYLRTEYTHSVFASVSPENLSYGKFSAGYGNIYTARQVYQLLLRCLGRFSPVEDRWLAPDGVIDPFRPGLRYRAACEKEFDLLTAAHLKAVLRAFSNCDVLIFTLGLTESWVSLADGAVFPACPGTVAGEFDETKHGFLNFSVDDVVGDLRGFIHERRAINPKVRVILTVSPVPLVATASGKHVLSATIYSKSVLRVAAEAICNECEDVHYFPAYEIVTGPQAPDSFFESDCRNVTSEAVETVMGAFLSSCESSGVAPIAVESPALPASTESLSQRIADIDCEEAAQDR